ncbi:DegT/DnrJ/EryC1/StrS family aminotransferase [Chitinispirillales bacterium ANBcel5]|uniref:DegT/DnrJ/EryC1/StrS family aminotransferase n=1 Tax=Cellulosispirillum alkaliphilum TaxID=3039283 RepID=UPI002A524DFB|nr:DegT/DnrJ/EryC1/StrS family aminotransferase [Chitinispirillales bacterium ANBcel5]
MNNIPFLDLKAQHNELMDEIIETIGENARNANFVGGPLVEEFEQDFARFCGSKYAIGVGSGTDALRFALMGAQVSPGDMVITVPNTFIATTEAITQAGAIPVFIDVDERTGCMAPDKLRDYLETHCYIDMHQGVTINKITDKPVKAVIPVHLFGQVADMDPIMDLAHRHNITIIEDACQAHGAQYFSQKRQSWLRAGSIGESAAFSFYPGKNLGAFGEAGAVTTNNEQLANRIRMLRDHGQVRKYIHEIEGYNGRLDTIQAAILLIKLRHLPRWNEMRRECAARYNELLTKISGVELPYEPIWSRSVYHLYVIQNVQRDTMQQFLSQKGIGTGLHYPVPLHLQKAYSVLGYKEGSFPVSERMCKDILSLPMFPTLGYEQQQRVAMAVMEFNDSQRNGTSEDTFSNANQ